MRNRDEPRRVKRKHPPVPVITGPDGLVGPLDLERFRETLVERRPLLAAPESPDVLRPYTTPKRRDE
jgi:hypothetical protein